VDFTAFAARPELRAGRISRPGDSPAGFRCRHGRLHRWDRSLSRRSFVRTAMGASALALGAGLPGRMRAAAQTEPAGPRPIPGGIDLGDGNLIHVYDYSQGFEPSALSGSDNQRG